MAKFKVGDRVFFKQDVEGTGVIAKIQSERDWLSGEMRHTYIIVSASEPNGYPFHPMAHFCYDEDVNAMAIWEDDEDRLHAD